MDLKVPIVTMGMNYTAAEIIKKEKGKGKFVLLVVRVRIVANAKALRECVKFLIALP